MEDLDYRHLPWLIHFDPSHNRRGFQHEDYTTTKEGKLIHGLNENNRKRKNEEFTWYENLASSQQTDDARRSLVNHELDPTSCFSDGQDRRHRIDRSSGPAIRRHPRSASPTATFDPATAQDYIDTSGGVPCLDDGDVTRPIQRRHASGGLVGPAAGRRRRRGCPAARFGRAMGRGGNGERIGEPRGLRAHLA